MQLHHATSQLPLKLAIAVNFLDKKPHTFLQISRAMQTLFPAERYVNDVTITTALQSLKTVGILHELSVTATTNDETFQLSLNGEKRIRAALGETLFAKIKELLQQ